MRSRMERYYKEEQPQSKDALSRSNRNKSLYEDLGKNVKYTSFTDVSKIEAVDLDKAKKEYQTREGYHKIKDYGQIETVPKVKQELEEFNYLYQDHENRVYDINSVLKEAKKNRDKIDEIERKRKLKNDKYNALTGLSQKDIEEYRKQKQNQTKSDVETGRLKELIDTITSKTLSGEISAKTGTDLLSNLMATTVDDKIDGSEDEKLDLSKEILDKEAINLADTANLISKTDKTKQGKTMEDIFKDMDSSFYTKSMDLSDKDFVTENMKKNEKKKIPLILKILFILILLGIIGFVIYFLIINH